MGEDKDVLEELTPKSIAASSLVNGVVSINKRLTTFKCGADQFYQFDNFTDIDCQLIHLSCVDLVSVLFRNIEILQNFRLPQSLSIEAL